MATSSLPERRFVAHTVSLEEDEFARTILLDGRRSSEDLSILSLQFAIDPQDGEEPYLEIPIQRFAADGGLQKFIIQEDQVVVLVDGEAGQRLGGIYRWTIALPANRRSDLVSFSVRAFSRHQGLLQIENT